MCKDESKSEESCKQMIVPGGEGNTSERRISRVRGVRKGTNSVRISESE